MPLLADTHVHSEFSWDTGGPASAARGTMAATCGRAVAIGLPAVIFTEHLDFDGWRPPARIPPHQAALVGEDGVLRPPPLEVAGWLESIGACRHAFPDLTILTGVEFGQPHRFAAEAAALLDLHALDRVNGSLHTLDLGLGWAEPDVQFQEHPAAEVMTACPAEIPVMVADPGDWPVVTHLDYALRSWPTAAEGPFDPRRFEGGFRTAMRAIAASGRAGDEHPPPRRLAAAVVGGGGQPRRQLRQRRPRAGGAGRRLPGGDGPARVVRLPTRPPPLGPLDPLTACAASE